MQIHVAGSVPEHENDEDGKFKRACKQIGAELAKRKHSLAIGGIGPDSAGIHLLEGTRSVDGTRQVYLYAFSHEMDSIEKEKEKLIRSGFSVEIRNELNSIKVTPVSDSASTLIIGGKLGTATAGLAAIAFGRPVLPLPGFDGASQTIWDKHKDVYERGLPKAMAKSISDGWNDRSAEHVLDGLEELARANPFLKMGQDGLLLVSSTTIAAIFVWISIFIIAIHAGYNGLYMLSFFMLLIVSSVFGTLFESVLSVFRNVESIYSKNVLIVDLTVGVCMGFVFFLLFFLNGNIMNTSNFVIDGSNFSKLAIFTSFACIVVSFFSDQALQTFRDFALKWLEDRTTK